MRLRIKVPGFWKKRNIISLLLLPFSLLYFIGFVIDKFLSRKLKANIFTIGVGNLNVGGSGKTPVCLWIAKEFTRHNKNFAIITKGYGGKLKGPMIVSESMTHSQVGDESLIYAMAGYPTITSKSKSKGVLYAKAHRIQSVVVDDALQSHKLYCDYKILVIDSNYGYGNGFLLPAGPMRQPILNTYKEANAIILIGNNHFSIPEEYSYKIYESNFVHHPPKHKKYIAFCGIGLPEKFYTTLKNYDIEILDFIDFPDHYYYQVHEIDEILVKAKTLNAEVITTYKDWVRLNKKHQKIIEYMNVELRIYNGGKLFDDILTVMDNANY